jgi:replicative DNA helicase
MSQDFEHLLIRKILGEEDFGPVADAGVTRKFFLNKGHRDVFDMIVSHKAEYGVVPTVETVQADFPTYNLKEAATEAYPFLIERLQHRHAMALAEHGLAEAAEAHDDGDLETFKAKIASTLYEIEKDVPRARDTDITKTREDRWARYMQLKNQKDGLRGIPTGFRTIDKATQGLQPKQLVTFIGPPKAGKSTLMLLAGMSAARDLNRVLFVGFEMSNDEQEERFDAIHAGISHSHLRGGQMTAEEEKRLVRSMKIIEEYPDYILSNDTSGAMTLTGIASKVEHYRPEILFVDGMYMMHDEQSGETNTSQALTNLTRGFKRLAQSLDIPIVISTQVLEWKMDKKKGVTSQSIGYSSSFAQDSDVILGVERVDPEIEENLNKVKVVLSRNCPPMESYIRWDWEHGKFQEQAEDYVPGGDDESGVPRAAF